MQTTPTSPTPEQACDERFDDVRREFERNFTERGEIGASVCVIHEGRTVVDLWAGAADPSAGRAWERDTMVVTFSCTKGAVALCTHMLARDGSLDLDAPIARYWPAFARTATAGITVRMLLNHQAGLPGITQRVPAGAIADFDTMVEVMSREDPLWRPGTRVGYHVLTYGWLIGEVVRRAAGETIGTFFRREVAEPLGIDFWIGLPASEEPRVARTLRRDRGSFGPEFEAALTRGEPIQQAVANTVEALLEPGGFDTREMHAAEIPAANGVTNARGLAGMYAPLCGDGECDGVTLVDKGQLLEMGAVESAISADAVGFEPMRHTPGFEKSIGRTPMHESSASLTLSEDAFGYTGFGGAVGFADPRARLAFGYAMNRHPNEDEPATSRNQPLIDAVYRSLGYHSRDAGMWA